MLSPTGKLVVIKPLAVQKLVEGNYPFIQQMYKFGTDYIKTKILSTLIFFGEMLYIVAILSVNLKLRNTKQYYCVNLS